MEDEIAIDLQVKEMNEASHLATIRKPKEEEKKYVFDRVYFQKSLIETKEIDIIFINDADNVFCPVV